MARLSKTVTIDIPGRDFGKTFVLTEMGARAAFDWAARAFFATGRSGMEVPVNALDQAKSSDNPGAVFVALAAFAGQALMGCSYPEAHTLMEEAWNQIRIVPADGAAPRPVDFRGDDIEEVWTIIQLKRELLELHLGLSISQEFAKFAGSLTDHHRKAMAFATQQQAAE
jgi:hypothetical protein